MNAPYVCQRCRFRIIAHGFKGVHQSRRAYIPLDNTSSREKDQDLVYIPKVDLSNHTKQTQRTVRPRLTKDDTSAALLESLFESTKRGRPELPRETRYSRRLNERVPGQHGNNEANNVEDLFQEDIAKLITMLRQKASINEIWDQTCSMMESSQSSQLLLHEPMYDKVPLFREILDRLIQEHVNLAVRSNVEDQESTAKIPSLASAVSKYYNWSIMKLDWLYAVIRRPLGLILTSPLVNFVSPRRSKSKPALVLLEDILNVWRCHFTRFTSEKFPDNPEIVDPSNSWLGLPPSEHLQVDLEESRYHTRFLHLFPDYPLSLGSRFATAAALTYLCLHIAKKNNILLEHVSQETQHFSTTLSRIIAGTRSDLIDFEDHLSTRELDPKRYETLRMRWSRMCEELRDDNLVAFQQPGLSMTELKSNEVQVGVEVHPLWRTPHTKKSHAISSDIRKAAKDHDLKFALKLWKRFQEKLELGQTDDMDVGAVFADFLWSFVYLDRSDLAIKTWAALRVQKVRPTICHWDAMLEACKMNKDLTSLEALWAQMKKTRVRPDNQAWTIYIGCILQSKDWRAALRIVELMGKAWVQNARDRSSIERNDPDSDMSQYSPSIVPVNAAIAGLFRLNQSEAAQSVLKWAREQALMPEVDTFNILLRWTARNADGASVQQVLTDMRTHNCSPDVITLTVLIDGLISHPASKFHQSSPEKQEAAVARVLDNMVASGLPPTPHTYGTLLHSLLQGPSPNLPAAQAILARMSVTGTKASQHIYTMLITHYFASSPPNLLAIDALWQRMKLERTVVDHVVYDRMIEGYARLGEAEKMQKFLRTMRSVGKLPGYPALEGALRTLAERDEWELCEDLVRDAESNGGLAWKRGWKGEEEFWDLVRNLRERGLIGMSGTRGVHHKPQLSGVDQTGMRDEISPS